MRLQISLIIFLACMLLPTLSAHAMTFDVKGKIVTVSGEADYPDGGKLIDAYEAGARIVVIKHISGSDFGAMDAVRYALEKRGMTTVISGDCGGSCIHLFIGGKERYFASAQNNGVGAFLAGMVEQGTHNPISSSKINALLSSRLSNAMPFWLLNKYTSAWNGSSTLKISIPSNALPNGALWDCPTGGKKCTRLDTNLDSVNIGFITSNQLFDLEKQELVDVPQQATKAARVSTPLSTAATASVGSSQSDPCCDRRNG